MLAPFFARVAWAGRAILFGLFLIAGTPIVSGVKTRTFEYKAPACAYKALYPALALFVRAGGERFSLYALGYIKSFFTFLAFVLICRHLNLSLPGPPVR